MGLTEKRAETIFTFAYPDKAFRKPNDERAKSQFDEKAHTEDPPEQSIAVMAFDNPSDNRKLGVIADGIATGVITKLSSLPPPIFVSSRMASFAYRGRLVKPQSVSRELKVRYILAGRIGRSKTQIRITADFIDGRDGHNIWSEQYDKTFHRTLNDVFAVESELADLIVKEIAPRLQTGKPSWPNQMTTNMSAWELISRARILIDQRTETDLTVASDLARQAVEIDNRSATAHAILSYVTMLRLHYDWESRAVAHKIGLGHARAAIRINSLEPWGHVALGFVRLHIKPVAAAAKSFEHAIKINRNMAFAYTGYGVALCYLGQGEKAMLQIDAAERLNPRIPFARGDLGANSNVRALACFVLKRYAEGIEFANRSRNENPELLSAYRNLVVNYALAGMIGEAKESLRILIDHQKRPLSLKGIAGSLGFVRSTDKKRYLDAFKLAGLK